MAAMTPMAGRLKELVQVHCRVNSVRVSPSHSAFLAHSPVNGTQDEGVVHSTSRTRTQPGRSRAGETCAVFVGRCTRAYALGRRVGAARAR